MQKATSISHIWNIIKKHNEKLEENVGMNLPGIFFFNFKL